MLATMVGNLLLGLIFFFIFLMVVVSSGPSDDEKVRSNSVLHLKFNKAIAERAVDDDFDFDLSGFDQDSKMGLNQIIRSIKAAGEDEKIKGIYMDMSMVIARTATIEEIRDALLEFKETGKWVIAYGEFYTQSSYYLASVADKMYLFPEGVLDFRGLNADVWFVKGLAEKLGIEMQIIRGKNNKFKSAVEPFMLDKMSEANREQTSEFVSSIWKTVLTGISDERGLTQDELNEIADNLSAQNGEKAYDLGMIDGLKYKDEILAELRDSLGLKENGRIRSVGLKKYNNTVTGSPYEQTEERTKNKIAVIYANGDIVSGEGDMETIGSDKIARAIRKARVDSTIKAVVLRINSPGGSALASDVIWREVVLTREKKPVVASMSDLAASGGYYIACAADKIYARESTITGSIGVFGMLPNAKEMFEDKMGITFDNVKTNRNADFGALTKPLTEEQYTVIQDMIEDIYDDFIGHVAEGRGMTKEEVDSIGQGRVWTGIKAKELGLVDEIGGLEEAVMAAAELAEIENYKIRSYPRMSSPFEELYKTIKGDSPLTQVANETTGLLGNRLDWNEVKALIFADGIQARMPFSINIE